MLYLASQSPQRTRLLRDHGIRHIVVASGASEASIRHPDPETLAIERARAKALGADLGGREGDWTVRDAVLGADTVVALGHRVFGKPRDEEDAHAMLAALSGRAHRVITAHCLWNPASGAPEKLALATSRVHFHALDAAAIARYVATGEPWGRAGAYAIQESGGGLVQHLEGDFDTVVGLNVLAVRRLSVALTGLEPEREPA